MTSFSESVSLPPSIISLHRVSPVRLQLGSASVISVQVQGQPLPWVSWFIGKNRIQSTNPNFRAEVVGDGRRHNLRVTKVTRDLDEGVAIEARNDAGTDYRRIAIAICQDEQVEDVPRRMSSTLASSSGASGCISGFGRELPVAGKSNYSFTDDVFDELISPGVPPLLLVQQKETIFPDEASREILCPTPDGSSGDPATTIKEKNIRRKSTGVKPGRHDNETVRSALEGGPTVKRAPQEIWKLDGVALDSVCRDLLRDSVPTEDDMDELVSKNENWKPNRLLDSKIDAKSETEKLGHNEKNTSQPSTLLEAKVTAPDANVKKTSRLAKLKDRIKKIRRLSSGKKQSSDDKDHGPNIGLHPTADNKALESQTMSKPDETPESVESPRGKTSTSKKTPRKKNSVSAENGKMVEVPYSAEAEISDVISVSRISTEKRTSLGTHENIKGYMSKNGLVERQNELAGSGDLSHAGYNGPEKPTKYKTSQSKECDSNDIQNENAITDAKRKDESIDIANKKVPQASGSRQIEYQTRGFPPIQLILKDQNASLESSDSNEIFDENRITLACSSPPADEVERCRHRLSSSQSQEKSPFGRLHQRGKDSDGRTGRRGYISSDDLDTDNSCGVASPTSPPEQCEGRMEERVPKTAPVETQVRGWVVEKRTRAGPTPRSRSCQRPSTAERRSWIENARSVEVQVPRRSRSTSRTRWRSLSKEWDLVTVTTTTEETRTTLPNAVAARAKAAVAIADKATPSEDEIKFGSTTTKTTSTPATTKTAKSTTKAKIEAQETVFEAAKKSPKLRAKQISMDTSQHMTSLHPERVIYKATQYSSVDSNSMDAGKSVLKSRSTVGQEEILSSSDSQRKSTTPRRSRKDQSEESNGKVSTDKGTNKNLFDASKRQTVKSSSSDFIQMPELEKAQTKEPNRDGVTSVETKAKAKISTAKRKQLGSVKVEDAELGKAGELSEARENDDVITELRNDTERAEFKADMNETNPEVVELRFKVNPDIRMVEISREVDEVDVNSEMNEVKQKTHLIEVSHEVSYDKETAESNLELDEAYRKRHSVQEIHEVNRNKADSVELNLELPEVVKRAKKTVDFSKGEVTELNEAVNKLSAEMNELNTDKAQISSKSVDPSANTMAAVEPSGKLRRSHLATQHSLLGLTEEDHGFRGRTQKKSVSLDSEVFEQTAEEVQLSSERTELNDEKAQLNRAMTRLSAEMSELNSDIPERTVSVSSPKRETYEVDIALPKRNSSSSSSSSMIVEGKNEGPDGRSSSSITVGHSFLKPHEKTLQKGHTSFQVSGPKRVQSNIVSETGKDRQREGKTKNSSLLRISDSVSHESTHADETESSVDGSVFERGEYDIQTGKSLTWTDSDDVFDRLTPVESVTPKVTSEVTHNVRNTDDADMTDSLTQEVTRGQQSEDAMTTVESMTTEVMSGISEDDDAADTLESLTPDVMSEVNAAVKEDTKISRTRATESSRGVIQVSIKPGDLLKFSQTIAEDRKTVDRRPDSGLSHETTSFEDTTDEDSYAIVDDNWKHSFDTCYTAMDALRAEEADTCEEEETSMAIENTLEYKQVEADTPESTRSTALVPDNGLNNRVSFPDDMTYAKNVHSYIVVGRRAETSIVGNDSKRNHPVLPDNRAKDTGTGRHSDFPEAADDQLDVHDYVTYIRSVFGSRSLSSSGEERDADTRNNEEAKALSDSARPLHITKRPVAKLARHSAIDTQDLNNETSKTVAEKIEDAVDELKSMAEETYADPAEAHSESNSPRFAVPEDAPVARAERKISVSSLVLRKPDVRHVTVEQRTIGSSAAYPTENAGHGAAVETDIKAHRSVLKTEITTPKPLIRSITLPGPFISQSQGDRGARSTNRVTSLVEIVINSLGIENVRASDLQLGRTDHTSLSEINLQLKKNYALEGPHLAKLNRTSLSGKKFQTEKNFVLEGPHLARSVSEIRLRREKNYVLEGLHLEIPNSTSLSEIKFQTEKTFVLEGPHLARPNLTSVSEIRLQREKNYALEGLHLEIPNSTSLSALKFQTEKTFVLEGPHLARPNLTSVSEIRLQREKNYALEGLHLEIPNYTSLSAIKFQTEKTFVLEGPHLARPNLTSVSEIRLQREKNYALEGLHLERPNYTSLSEIKFQSEKTFVLGGPHLARPNLTSLSEIQFQTEKNYTLEGPCLARPPYRTSLSEIKLQTGKNSAIKDSHLSKPNRTSLSEIKIQKEKNFALEGPLPVSHKTTAKPTANQTFRTILTIIGQGSKDDASPDKEPETGIAKNKNPKLNYPPNEVTSLNVPTRITVPLDLTGSSTATHETDANTSEQQLPTRLYSSKAGETSRSDEDNKVLVRSESVKWNPSSGGKVDNTNNNSKIEILNGSSSETRKVRIEDKDTQDYESVVDSEEGYDATSLDVNQVNLNIEQSLKTPEDSDKFQENVALASTMNAGDMEVEEGEFQQDAEFPETRYEYESNEIISEMTHEDGIHFNQATIVTSVESESEPENGGDTNENSWKEESVDRLKDKGEERESYNNDTEAFHGNETEENDETIDELKAEVGSHLDQTMVVTSVETEEESENGDAGKTIRTEEESEYIQKDEEEERNRDINLTEEHYDNELEEHNETIGEAMLEEDESHFNQVAVLTRIETEGESVSGNADKIPWKEEETVDIPADEEEEEQYEKDIEEHHDIRSELSFEDESRFDQVVVITSVETEVEVESGKGDKTEWREKGTLDVLNDEEMKKSRGANVADEHYDSEIIEELITEDGSPFDDAPHVTSVEAESEIENGNSSKTSWIEEELLDMLKDDEMERNRSIDITEADDDNESTEHHEAICELIAEYVGESSREDEPESEDVETSGIAEKTSWEEAEEVDMLADEEDRNEYISVIEGHNDNKVIDELTEEDEGHLDPTVIVTCVETEDESQSGNAGKISLEEEETVDMLADEEEVANYEEVIEEHRDTRDELIFEDESRFDQWTVITNVETDYESKNENIDKMGWKEEEAVDILIDEEKEKEEKEEDMKRYVDITETQNEKEIEEHREISEELTFEDESRFDQWTVITTVETENESESVNAEETAWKEEIAIDVVKDEEVEKSRRDNEVTDEWITEDGGFDHTIIITTSVETENESESGNAEEKVWKEEVAIDVVKDEAMKKSRRDNEDTDEWITEDGGFDHTIIITTSVETEGKSESGDAGKTLWTEEESENIQRDEEEDMNKYLELTEAQYDNELEEHNETIGEVMLEEDESHFDEVTVFTRIETEVESDSERVDMSSWKEAETIDTQADEVTSGQQISNPEPMDADFNDSSEHVEIKENGEAQEDTEIDYETTSKLEGVDNNGSQIEHVDETEELQTLVRPNEKSYSEQSAGEHQTIRGTVSNSDYESRSEDVSERIWKLLESQGAKRKESPRTETQSAEYLESTSQSLSEKRWQEIELQHKEAEKTLTDTDSQSDDYLESMRQSLSEKRWQEIERIRREASEKALAAAAQGSVNNNAEKGFDYETWHKGFSIRKFQTINATGKPKNPEDGDETCGSFGNGKFETISEIETTDSAETEKHPENTEDNEYESFSTGMHEEGWRTITRNEQPSANTNSKINGDHTDSAKRGESKSDNDYMVTYEYGEMFSVFHHLPCSIETLRESVMDNFNSSPTMRRLLTRYPSLRPGTWKWNGQRPLDNTGAQDTQLREVQHLETVSVADQFTPQLMTEKFDTV